MGYKKESGLGAIFWDTTQCSPVRVHRRFDGHFCFHLHGVKIRKARVDGNLKHFDVIYYYVTSGFTCVSRDISASIFTV
jgi:hypothetical protein